MLFRASLRLVFSAEEYKEIFFSSNHGYFCKLRQQNIFLQVFLKTIREVIMNHATNTRFIDKECNKCKICEQIMQHM